MYNKTSTATQLNTMAVKFEFTLSDIDASNLISILHDEQVRALVRAREFIKKDMTQVDQANFDWYNRHADYLQELKEKVLAGNTRVETVL